MLLRVLGQEYLFGSDLVQVDTPGNSWPADRPAFWPAFWPAFRPAFILFIDCYIINTTRDEAWGYDASTAFQIVRCKPHGYANRFGCRLQG